MTRRRIGLLITFALGLLLAPLTSQAQHTAQVPRLGLLMPGSASTSASRLEAFRHGLRDLGYVEGRTITLEYRFAEGQADRLSALVAELVRLPVDVLVVDGTVAILWGLASSPASHAPVAIPRGWPA
jgi:putative tryptophan/tyrosine transport system substrate-binding protein